jgi:hypothetical protein
MEDKTMNWLSFYELYRKIDEDETEVKYKALMASDYADYLVGGFDDVNLPDSKEQKTIDQYYRESLQYNPLDTSVLESYAEFLTHFMNRDEEAKLVLKKAIDICHSPDFVDPYNDTLFTLLFSKYLLYSRLLAKNPDTQEKAQEYKYKAFGLDPGMNPDVYDLYFTHEELSEDQDN